jgi:class 3 adenylate cyclase
VGFALEGIAAGDIRNIADLRARTDAWPEGPFKHAAFETGFALIKKLHWGYFESLDPARFPGLWTELVLPDPKWDFAGDLKRSISLPNLFIGLIDLHGYTKFCRENRKNLSRLTQLDAIIQHEVPKVVSRVGVLARRVRGDEILMIGASAADVVEAVLLAGEFFRHENAAPGSAEKFPNVFPRFEIAAGVAGGQGFTDLVVTEDGDLSGDAVNTAARLQSRAGRISPDRARIMVTGNVERKLASETARTQDRARYRLLQGVEFMDAGKVEFKGVTVSVHDAVFTDGPDARRLEYRHALESLYESLEARLWRGKVFEDAVRLAEFMGSVEGNAMIAQSRLQSRLATVAFSQERYEDAVAEFGSLIELLTSCGGADPLALEYLRGVLGCYRRLAAAFAESLDAAVDSSPSMVFTTDKDAASFKLLKTHNDTFIRVRDAARQRVRNRKALWYRVSDGAAEDLRVRVGEPK